MSFRPRGSERAAFRLLGLAAGALLSAQLDDVPGCRRHLEDLADLARDWAARDHRALRLDFAGRPLPKVIDPDPDPEPDPEPDDDDDDEDTP